MENEKRKYSLKDVMSEPKLLDLFTQFSLREHSFENLLFLKAVNSFKENLNQKTIKKRAKTIIKAYIQDSSEFELNVKKKTKDEILESFKKNEITENLFDKSYKEVSAIISDTLLRFYSSDDFNDFVTKKEQRKLSIQDTFTNFIYHFSERRTSDGLVGETKKSPETVPNKKFSVDFHKIFKCSPNLTEDLEFSDPSPNLAPMKKKSIDGDPIFKMEENFVLGEKN